MGERNFYDNHPIRVTKEQSDFVLQLAASLAHLEVWPFRACRQILANNFYTFKYKPCNVRHCKHSISYLRLNDLWSQKSRDCVLTMYSTDVPS